MIQDRKLIDAFFCNMYIIKEWIEDDGTQHFTVELVKERVYSYPVNVAISIHPFIK